MFFFKNEIKNLVTFFKEDEVKISRKKQQDLKK